MAVVVVAAVAAPVVYATYAVVSCSVSLMLLTTLKNLQINKQKCLQFKVTIIWKTVNFFC